MFSFPFLRRRNGITILRAIEINESLRYTPDAPFLETVNPWLVFVYDSFMKHHRRHPNLLQMGAKYPSRRIHGLVAEPSFGYTNGDYVLWKHKAGARSFPVPIDRPMKIYQNRPAWDLTGGQAFKIRGEIYEMDWRGVTELDEYYRNGVEFERRKVGVVQCYHYELENPDGRTSMSLRHEAIIPCWMYVGIGKFWDKHIDGTFEPVHVFPRRGGTPPYYYFTHHEYRS
jgi:hypothetical protein